MRKVLLLLVVYLSAGSLWGAERKVSGCVTGADGNTLPYANIVLKNSATGTISDLNGKYRLHITEPGYYTFIVNYVGYEPIEKRVYIHRDTTIDFRLREDVMNLSEVVVTGTRTPKMLKDAPVITRVITADEIKRLDATTIKDLLEMELPGLEFTRQMDGQTAINMQGMGGSDMLFLVDGERLAGETLNNVDYGRLNMDNVERIEIVKGAASALYGSNAVGGVVNIITKNASEPWSLNVNGRYGSHNEQRYGMTVGLKQGKVSSFTNVSYKNIDTYILDNTPADLQSVYGNRDYSVNEKFTYAPNEKWSFNLKGGYFNRERDFSAKQKNRYVDYNGSANANYVFSDRMNLEMAYVFDSYEKSDYYPKSGKTDKDYRNEQHTARAQYNYSFTKGNMLTGGAEFFRESLFSSQFKGLAGAYGEHSTNTTVVYLQHDYNVLSSFNLLYGVRMDYHSKFGAHFSPKVSVMYKLAPYTFRASYSGGFRSPSLKELFTDWDMGGLGIFRVIGNEKLDPESSHNYSVSAEYTRKRVNFTVMGYYTRVRDKISTVYNTARDSSFYRNVGRSVVCGADASLSVKCPYGFGAKLSYAYVHDVQKYEGVNISQTRPHSATLRVDYGFEKKKYSLNTALSGRALSKLTSYSVEEDQNRVVSIKENYPAYTMWRLVVTQQFRQAFTLTTGIDNLFNYKPDVYSFNSPLSSGITFFAGVSINVERLFK